MPPVRLVKRDGGLTETGVKVPLQLERLQHLERRLVRLVRAESQFHAFARQRFQCLNCALKNRRLGGRVITVIRGESVHAVREVFGG